MASHRRLRYLVILFLAVLMYLLCRTKFHFSAKEKKKYLSLVTVSSQDLNTNTTRNPLPLTTTRARFPTNQRPLSLQAKPRPKVSNTTLLHDLLTCSQVMGVSEKSLRKDSDIVNEVSRRANVFLKEIRSLLPLNFSTNCKNPCWMAERSIGAANHSTRWEEMILSKFHSETSGRIQKGYGWRYNHYLSKPADKNSVNNITICLPYFFLAGFPKSATTTVHKFLSKHAQIIAPREKEPHWWTRVLHLASSKEFNPEYFRISLIAYTIFFKNISSKLNKTLDYQLITYDGSQSLLWDSNFYYKGQDYCAMPAVLSRVLPNAKFIIVMRNPVTRLYSHFLFSCKLQYTTHWARFFQGTEAQVFHEQVTKDISAFKACLKTMSTFECTSRMIAIKKSNKNCNQIWHKLNIGMYVLHIKKWLQFYPIENFLFIKMEDISNNTMFKITQFLGIDSVSSEVADLLTKRENSLENKNLIHPMEARTKLLLSEFYKSYNQELAELLNDRRFLWEEQEKIL